MVRKAQGLPITTVALIIIVIIVLAVVAIFFFTYFSKGTSSANIFNCQQLCGAEKAYYVDNKVWRNAADTQFCKQGCNKTSTNLPGTCCYETSCLGLCPP
jgi:flagellar basal body-associated protein FliL